MIKSITAVNYLNESLRMELARPEESGFAITSIRGLGPPKVTINTTELSTNDGSVYNSARAESRNIVLSIRFLPNPTIEHTRHLSYKFFPVKKPVKLVIETDTRLCETSGYVESNEPDIFNKEESAQISIICTDPYLYSAGEQGTNVTVFHGTEALFEFPFPGLDISNDVLDESILEFGSIENAAIRTVYYEGDAEIGIAITIHAIGPASNITIFNTQTRESMHIDTDKLETLTGAGIDNGDEIVISTLRGEKSIMLLREGVYTNILNCLNRNADWFQLFKGDNLFAYTVESGSENLQFRIENRTAYEGV